MIGRSPAPAYRVRRAGRLVLAALVLPLLAGVPQAALASWVATGSFFYVDREFDENGFTGFEPIKPVREADVEIVDANLSPRKQVIARGTTAADGSFSIFVSDTKTRDVYARVVTRSEETPDLFIDVRTDTGNNPDFYASATPTTMGHLPSVNLAFAPAVAPIGQGGEAFNIYDQMLKGADYLASLNGARPDENSSLYTVWAVNGGITGASYSRYSLRINLRDSAGYDDTVVLHEMGHYAIFEYSQSQSPGGFHTFAVCDTEIRLAFDEGFATYWGNSARRFHGDPLSNVYLRSNGAPGPGNVVRTADLETDTQYQCVGATNEVNVFVFLWDIVDGPGSPDATPGIDDSHDSLDLDDTTVWQVMTDELPGTSNTSLEDWWNGWFALPAGVGTVSDLLTLSDHVGIMYFEDASEENDSALTATPFNPNGPPAHGSYFRDPEMDGSGAPGDLDMYWFLAASGTAYVIQTDNLLDGADSFLRLRDSDGFTLLAFNDDKGSGDDSSRIDFTAPRDDVFFVEVTENSTLAEFGQYDLFITTTGGVDGDGDGYDSVADCNDGDPDINPGEAEVCDGVDQNCNGQIDEGFDEDVDGYTTCQGDCRDGNPAINPGAPEIPLNGKDDDCNGLIDDADPPDQVEIIEASWWPALWRLYIEATSSESPTAVLTVDGFGDMTWDVNLGVYTYSTITPEKPDFVFITSSAYGSDTAIVVLRTIGGGGGDVDNDGGSCNDDRPEDARGDGCEEFSPE